MVLVDDFVWACMRKRIMGAKDVRGLFQAKKIDTIRIRGNVGGEMGLSIVESARLGGLEAREARKTIKQFERWRPIFFRVGRGVVSRKNNEEQREC